MGQDSTAQSPWTGCSQFLPTTQKIIQFSDGKPPQPNDKIVSLILCFDFCNHFHGITIYSPLRFMLLELLIYSMLVI